MKRIHIKIIQDPDSESVWTERQAYRTFLFWGVSNTFTNKKKAEKFQADLNSWLNSTMIELNSIYARMLWIVRLSWPFFTKIEDNKLSGMLQTVENEFNRMIRTSNKGTDAALYCFQCVRTIAAQLIECIEFQIEFRKDRLDWEQAKELEMYGKQIRRLLDEIEKAIDPGAAGIKRRN
jgi:hypothetical protein